MARNKNTNTINYNRVAELTKLNWSAPKIAAELGCSARQVTRIRGHLRIAQERRPNSGIPVSPERLEQAQKLADDGASAGEIVRTMRMSRVTVNKYFPEARQNGDDWRHLWGQIRNDPKMRRLFDEMGGIT